MTETTYTKTTHQESPGGEIVVYGAPDGVVRVDVRLDRETVWLTQRQMAELFDTTPENGLMHLQNIVADGDLDAEATTKDFLVVQNHSLADLRDTLLSRQITGDLRVPDLWVSVA